MITFAIGLFTGAFICFIFAAILAMSDDVEKYAGKGDHRKTALLANRLPDISAGSSAHLI
jgi:hypothetical protein